MRFFQRVLCLLRLNKIIEIPFSGCFACCGQNKSYMRFFQRVLCLLRLNKRLNKLIVAFFSAGILPATDKIKVLCVSFTGCFACCGSIKYLRSFQLVLCLLRPKDLYAFLSSGYFACCEKIKVMRFFQRVLCLLRPNKIIFQRVLCLLRTK